MEDHLNDNSRRDALKKLGVGAGIAWSAPVVSSFFSQAAAGTPPPPSTTLPPEIPECRAATCETFVECTSLNPDCICVNTPEGGFCVPGSTPCSVGPECNPDLSCPSGMICFVDTCCGFPVCGPIDLVIDCPPDDRGPAATRGARAKVAGGFNGTTFGG